MARNLFYFVKGPQASAVSYCHVWPFHKHTGDGTERAGIFISSPEVTCGPDDSSIFSASSSLASIGGLSFLSVCQNLFYQFEKYTLI